MWQRTQSQGWHGNELHCFEGSATNQTETPGSVTGYDIKDFPDKRGFPGRAVRTIASQLYSNLTVSISSNDFFCRYGGVRRGRSCQWAGQPLPCWCVTDCLSCTKTTVLLRHAGMFSCESIVPICKQVAPLLLHPNAWIRKGILLFIRCPATFPVQ